MVYRIQFQVLIANYNWLRCSFPDYNRQFLHDFCDRLSILMSSSIPFLWLFGLRNNPLLWITGWSYRTFNIFHRWVAMLLLVEAILHGSIVTAYLFAGKILFNKGYIIIEANNSCSRRICNLLVNAIC